MSQLPRLFFDRELPVEYHDLVEGRAAIIGPDDADLASADAVIAGITRRWDAASLTGVSVRVVSRSGIGYDNVDVDGLAAIGVVVCNTPSAPTVSTAEHTMTLLLAITKGLPAQIARAAEGLPSGVPTALELDGRVLGLVGCGRIARRVGAAARALGMITVGHDPYVTEDVDGVDLVSLEVLLQTSDVVSLHAPAMAETRHLIDASSLRLMKRGAYLVNCARGALVDHDALLGALDSGHLAGAALDVTEPEPLPVGHPLLGHPKAIVTPHMASSTSAGRRRLYAHAIDNALAVLDGRPASTVAPSS
jgi:D-3-phosphoglycerate dehydrogenase / 2-oxoglutarate reductase